MTDGRYRLIGSTASPYAIKLRALLRYRRIPFDWVIMTKALRKATEHLRPNLIPVLQYPDGAFHGETTMLAYDLERRHRQRSVIPEDKALAFVCDLLEDLADEWAVKPLFLYRWWDPEDQAYVSRWAGEEWSVSEVETGSAEEIETFSPAADFAHGHPWRDCGKQAIARGKLSANTGRVRGAYRHD